MELTRGQLRLCIVRMFHYTIQEYRYLKRQRKLTDRQRGELRRIESFLFGRKSAATALELVFGEKIDKIRKVIMNDPKKRGR